MKRALALVAVPLVLGTLVTTSACNRRVFKQVEISCDKTIDKPLNIPAEKAADILVVVDNSGSMFEEQQNLAANFLNGDGSCPIGVESLGDFARCDDATPPDVCRFANPTEDQLSGELSNCGFIQILAAYENNFRVGVITTDVGLCDNRISLQQAAQCSPSTGTCVLNSADTCDDNAGDRCANDWGYRPQRGCLQPNGPPGTAEKFIQRSDSDSDDANIRNIGARFKATLDNIRTFGSPYERGLDAVEEFLDPNSSRSPGCEDDLANFLRKDAKLVVIFLSDEEDCSHRPGSEFPEELADEVCGEFDKLVKTPFAPAKCYTDISKLTPVQHYADFLTSLKDDANDVSVAVIAGGIKEDGEIVAGGCFPPQGDGDPLGGCEETRGNSNSSACERDPSVTQCCRADPGGRYFELADKLGGLKDSICVSSFRKTMIKIASFIGAVDFVDLEEAPADINLMFVEVKKAGATDSSVVPRLVGDECGDGNGWVYQEPDAETHRVRFCGTARPGPGDDVSVRAKANRASADPASDNPCELAASN